MSVLALLGAYAVTNPFTEFRYSVIPANVGIHGNSIRLHKSGPPRSRGRRRNQT
jgi:hypothetical protein